MSETGSKPANSEYCVENVYVYPVPRSFYEWLNAIRERPGCLQRKTLECLYSWIEGYQASRQEIGLPASNQEKEFADFDLFVCQRYDWYDNAGWPAKITYYNRDDREALDQFFKLLDEFRVSKQRA